MNFCKREGRTIMAAISLGCMFPDYILINTGAWLRPRCASHCLPTYPHPDPLSVNVVKFANLMRAQHCSSPKILSEGYHRRSHTSFVPVTDLASGGFEDVGRQARPEGGGQRCRNGRHDGRLRCHLAVLRRGFPSFVVQETSF